MVTEKEKKSIFIVFLKHLFWPNPPLKEIVNVVFFWFSQIQSNVKSTSLSLIRQITMLAIAWIFFPICCAALANTNWLFYIYSVASMPSPSAYCRLESFAFSFFFFKSISSRTQLQSPLCGMLVWVLAHSPNCALMVFEFCNSVRPYFLHDVRSRFEGFFVGLISDTSHSLDIFNRRKDHKCQQKICWNSTFFKRNS